MPFEISNAPSIVIRLMNKVLKPIIKKSIMVKFIASEEEH